MALGGVNRASLGVQSFDPKVQHAINRVQSFAQTADVTGSLRRAGIAGVNFDLIYGLPHQTVASCIETVRQCVELRPDRFSVFGYAHVPAFKKHQRKIDENVLPDSLERHEQASAIGEALKDAGYVQVGLDHFALPGDAMAVAFREGRLRRNFQGYTTDTSDVLIGFGASAIGSLPQGYVQNEMRHSRLFRGDRGRATCDRQGLCADRRRSAARRHHRAHHVRLRRRSRHGLRAPWVAEPEAVLNAAPRLTELISNGVVALDGASLAVAEHSRFLVRSVAAAFDAHLDASRQLHSRAV